MRAGPRMLLAFIATICIFNNTCQQFININIQPSGIKVETVVVCECPKFNGYLDNVSVISLSGLLTHRGDQISIHFTLTHLKVIVYQNVTMHEYN